MKINSIIRNFKVCTWRFLITKRKVWLWIVRCFPVVLGTDEQELNKGLREKLHAGKIKTIGLNDLPKFIQKFIISKRIYAHSSNIYTEFIAGTMSTEDCESSLKKIICLANSCEQCLTKDRWWWFIFLNWSDLPLVFWYFCLSVHWSEASQ